MITDADHFHGWLTREYKLRPCSQHELEDLEARVGHQFPQVYRKFLLTFGSVNVGNVTLLGADPALNSDFNVLSAIALMHAIDPHFPSRAVPVMLANRTNFLCLNC